MLSTGPSLLMADPMGPLLDQDEEALSPSSSLEGKAPASPPLSFSSYASSLSPFQTLSSSPPPSPPDSSFLGTKVRVDPLSPHWLYANGLLDAEVGADDGEGEGDFKFQFKCLSRVEMDRNVLSDEMFSTIVVW